MFNKDIKIIGKHAYYTQALSPRKKETHSERIFHRYIDLYMIGAVVGFIQGIKESVDKDEEFKGLDATIRYDTISQNRDKLLLVYRTILLLDKANELSDDERIEKAFKDDLFEDRIENKEENDKLFNDYVRGGISYLYSKLYKNTSNLTEQIDKIKEYVESFHNEHYDKTYLEEIDYDKDRVY